MSERWETMQGSKVWTRETADPELFAAITTEAPRLAAYLNGLEADLAREREAREAAEARLAEYGTWEKGVLHKANDLLLARAEEAEAKLAALQAERDALVRWRRGLTRISKTSGALLHRSTDGNNWHEASEPCCTIYPDGTTECGWRAANPEPEPAVQP